MKWWPRLRRTNWPVPPPALILVVSLLLTGLVWWGARVQAQRLADVQFVSAATDVVSAIDKRMRDYQQILRGGVAYMRAEDLQVGRQEWRAYVDALRVEENYPGIQGVGFSLRVTPQTVAEHEGDVRAQGLGGYTVYPEGPREEIHAIVFLEPLDARNRRALGYDMYSDPTRRAAMSLARDAATPALSGKVTLVQEITQDIQNGTLLYLPVYRGDGVPQSVEERRDRLAGFVYSPFRMGDLIRGIVWPWLDEVVVRLHDGSRDPANRLFGPSELPDTGYLHSAALDVYGRRWIVDVAATPQAAAALTTPYPAVVLASGVVISVLLWWLSRAMIAERRRRLALARANRQLAEAQSRAEAAGNSKSKFLAAASHDIRQPVQSLVLLVAALARKLAGHPAHMYVTQLERSLDALRLLLDGLLDISRLDAGVVVPQVQALGLADLLGRLRRDYAPRAAAAGLDLRVVGCSAWVLSDPALLERILRNLIENALRYTHAGRIVVGCRRRGDALSIEVHDTGIGIDPAHRAAIFEEFFQVGNPERDRDKGLGLGLAIVRRLAGLLGHRLDLSSEVGRGSSFRLTVPGASRPPQEAPPLFSERGFETLARRLTVLVIDDEEMVRDALRLMLADWGCATLTAGDAEEAVAVIESSNRRPDVVVADYRLRSGRTGLQAIQRVRSFVRSPVPGIVLTGDTAPERIAEATRSGHTLLHKPISPRELQKALEDLSPVA